MIPANIKLNKIDIFFIKVEQYSYYLFFILLLVFINPIFVKLFTNKQIVSYFGLMYLFVCLFTLPTLWCAIKKIGKYNILRK